MKKHLIRQKSIGSVITVMKALMLKLASIHIVGAGSAQIVGV